MASSNLFGQDRPLSEFKSFANVGPSTKLNLIVPTTKAPATRSAFNSDRGYSADEVRTIGVVKKGLGCDRAMNR